MYILVGFILILIIYLWGNVIISSGRLFVSYEPVIDIVLSLSRMRVNRALIIIYRHGFGWILYKYIVSICISNGIE